MRGFLNILFTAIGHLTISKAASYNNISKQEIKKSLSLFPFVGFYIGCFLVLINSATSYFLPAPIVDITLVLFLLVFTRTKHLRGFLVFVSGISGFSENKSMPSDIETKWFLLLFFILTIKIMLLNSIVPGWKNAVLLVMPVMGRWSLILLPYLKVNRPDKNLYVNPLYGEIDEKDFWTGTITASMIALLLLGVNGIIIFMLITFMAVFFERLYQRKTNGMPENFSLGIVEITEILTLLFFIVLESSSQNFISEGILV